MSTKESCMASYRRGIKKDGKNSPVSLDMEGESEKTTVLSGKHVSWLIFSMKAELKYEGCHSCERRGN